MLKNAKKQVQQLKSIVRFCIDKNSGHRSQKTFVQYHLIRGEADPSAHQLATGRKKVVKCKSLHQSLRRTRFVDLKIEEIRNSRDCKMVKGIWSLIRDRVRLDVFRTLVQTARSCWSGLYNQEGSQLFANADICSQVNHSQSHHQIISLGFVFKTTNWYHSGEISSITNTLFGLHLGWMSEGRQHI